ncbi:hypothetical protein MASR2M117_16600 [Paludibacter sp.]
MPFYNVEEYYEQEINPQDISFLIWYFLNTVQEDMFISPYNQFIEATAEIIYDIFDEAWEFVPENEYLKKFYQIDNDENNFYTARNLIDTVLFQTYLFYPDSFLKLQDEEIEIINNSNAEQDTLAILNENRDIMLHKTHTRLLALSGKEWAAEILSSNRTLNKDFLSISQKIQGLFLYKGQDENNIFIEHIASGKKFNLTKQSFDYSQELKELDTILYIGIVKWKDEWWFSGVFFQQPFNQDIILDEKKSFNSRLAVNFLDHQEHETDKNLKNELSVFKDFNRGSQIAFLTSDRIEKFIREFIAFSNKALNISKEKIKKAEQRAKNEGFLEKNDTHEDFSEIADTGLVFFNPNSGSEIALGVNSAFPMSSNPYFNEEESEDHIMHLLIDDSYSKELVNYCIDNCKTKLSFFTKGAGKKYLEDMDFLLRFWKKSNYHTVPSLTYIG